MASFIKKTQQCMNKTEVGNSNPKNNCDSRMWVKNKNTASLNDEVIETKIFLKAVKLACEAIIACMARINMLDGSSCEEQLDKCGSRLSKTADNIIKGINEEEFNNLSIASMLFRIALKFKENYQDPQADLYTNFFLSLSKAIEKKEVLGIMDWIDAFTAAIDSVDKIVKHTRFYYTLLSAKQAFHNAFAMNPDMTVTEAIDKAVTAAQNQTSHIIMHSGRINDNSLSNEYCGFSGLAGAYALGVWMRGAFEGFKSTYRARMPQNGDLNITDNNSDVILITQGYSFKKFIDESTLEKFDIKLI